MNILGNQCWYNFQHYMKFMEVINEFLWWVKRVKPRQTLKQHFIAWIMWGAFLIIFPSSIVWSKPNMINMSHLDLTKYREKHKIIILFRFDLVVVFFLILITFKFPMYVHTKSTVHRDNLSSSFFSINI